MGYPNLKQRIGWFDDLPDAVARVLLAEGARIVAMLPETPRAVAADEAIDNRDRNLGNILWDGANVAWIDHERTLGLVPMEDANKLAQLVAHGADDVARIQRAAVAVALTLSAQVIDAAKAECAGIDVAAFARLVSERLGPLAARVCNRFPRPDDLLNRLT